MYKNLFVCQNLYKISLVLNVDKAFGYKKLFVYQSVYEIRLVLNVDKAPGYQTFVVRQRLYEMILVLNVDQAFGYQKRFVYQHGYILILVLNVCVQKTTCQASYVPKTCWRKNARAVRRKEIGRAYDGLQRIGTYSCKDGQFKCTAHEARCLPQTCHLRLKVKWRAHQSLHRVPYLPQPPFSKIRPAMQNNNQQCYSKL